jgi:hypothetical protein
MCSTSDLIQLFHSLNIEETPVADSDYDIGYIEGHDNGYKLGYMEGYEHGKNRMENMAGRRHAGRPPFGWEIKNSQLVENTKEQIIIEMIRRILKENPKTSLTDICKILTYHGFSIRQSKRIYPTMIKNIILTNNL